MLKVLPNSQPNHLRGKGRKDRESETAFGRLRELLTTAPLLQLPYPHGYFVVCTDASLKGLGRVITQNGRVIAYESRRLRDYGLNYATHDLELAVYTPCTEAEGNSD